MCLPWYQYIRINNHNSVEYQLEWSRISRDTDSRYPIETLGFFWMSRRAPAHHSSLTVRDGSLTTSLSFFHFLLCPHWHIIFFAVMQIRTSYFHWRWFIHERCPDAFEGHKELNFQLLANRFKRLWFPRVMLWARQLEFNRNALIFPMSKLIQIERNWQ